MSITSEFDGPVLLLEDDMILAPDTFHFLDILQKETPDVATSVQVMGNLLPTYKKEETKVISKHDLISNFHKKYLGLGWTLASLYS